MLQYVYWNIKTLATCIFGRGHSFVRFTQNCAYLGLDKYVNLVEKNYEGAKICINVKMLIVIQYISFGIKWFFLKKNTIPNVQHKLTQKDP